MTAIDTNLSNRIAIVTGGSQGPERWSAWPTSIRPERRRPPPSF